MKEQSKLHIIGKISNPKIMLIHGVGFYWETCFKEIIEALSGQYCILLPELEGHCRKPTKYMSSVSVSATEILDEIKEKGITQIDVVYGISLGASIALEIAMKNQLIISHLILDSGQYESMGEMTEQFSVIMAQQFLNLLKGEHLISPIKENMGYENKDDVKVLQPLIFPEITYDALYHAFLAAYDYDIKECIEKIRMNVVIMLGGNEIYAKNSIPLVEEKCINPPQVYEVPDKGHAEVLSKEPNVITGFIKQLLLQEK